MDGCFGGDDASFEYMNTPSVQETFHVRESALARPPEWRWSVCADEPYVNYTKTVLDLSKSVIPGLVKNGVRVLVFSGDVDACVPYTGSRIWVAEVAEKWEVINDFKPWTVAGQVAGYMQSWQTSQGTDFTFATVKNAGHMVPQTQPHRAFALVQRFISGQKYIDGTEDEKNPVVVDDVPSDMLFRTFESSGTYQLDVGKITGGVAPYIFH